MRIIFAIVLALCIFDLPVLAQEEDDYDYAKHEKQFKSGILCKRRQRIEYRQDTVWRLWIYTDSVSKNDTGLFSFLSQEIAYPGKEPLFTHHTTISQYDHDGKILFERKWWKPSIQDGMVKEINYTYDQKGRLVEKNEYKWGRGLTQKDIYSYDDSKRIMVYTTYDDSNNVDYEALHLYDSLFRLQAVYPTFFNENREKSIWQIPISRSEGQVSASYEYQDSDRRVTKTYYDEEGPYLMTSEAVTDSFKIISKMTFSSESFLDTVRRASTLFESKGDLNGQLIESKETDLRTGKVKIYNSSTDDSRDKVYDSKGKLIRVGREKDNVFSGTTYSYNDQGDQAEAITYRNGKILERHNFTYTYAK